MRQLQRHYCWILPRYGYVRIYRTEGIPGLLSDHYEDNASKLTNEEVSLDFLERIRAKYPTGRVYLVLDNAGYFTTKQFKQYAQSMAIELLYLPPYAPNLNLIERIWLFFQKNILYNKYYPDFELFKEACHSFFENFDKNRDSVRDLLVERFEIITPT